MTYQQQGQLRLPDDDDDIDDPTLMAPAHAGLSSGVAGATGINMGMGGAPGGQLPPPGTVRINKYETALPIRLDIEAALAYALGPITGALFLILETKNDYVRFHAWQSSLTFVAIMLVQVLFSIFSSTLVWLVFGLEVALAAWMGYQAYINADSLARYQLPYFGPVASNWVDTE
ncbi:hypothetical protein BC831DRAFT_397325 [Entophlyctis helioformis]|nr:hypothetical protein BC831DRAFT_397325 [Entophlyctis helioformis]